MEAVSLKDLLEAGCHFGHKADRWHPKAAEFIYQERNGIHVIDLAKTKAGLEKAAEFIKDILQNSAEVLFIGTKRQAASIIREEATRVGAPYIAQRWIGGFLTNWEQVHKNLEKIRRLTEEEKTGAWNKYPKHERVKLSRYLKRLLHLYSGVIELREPPKALVVVDIKREDVAIREAHRMQTPVVGVVDTNSDPTQVDFVIPSNDDAVGAINYLVHYLANAYLEGKEEREKEQAKEKRKVESKKKGETTEQIEEGEKKEEVKVEETKPKRRGRPKKEVKIQNAKGLAKPDLAP